MIKLNTQQICEIYYYPKSESIFHVYKNERKFFSFILRKGGFYYDPIFDSATFTTKEEIEADGELYCEGNKVFFKPHIEILMSNKVKHRKYFQTEAEMYKYIERPEFYGIPFIKIEM